MKGQQQFRLDQLREEQELGRERSRLMRQEADRVRHHKTVLMKQLQLEKQEVAY